MNGDRAMRAHSDTLPAPTFPDAAWVTPKPLHQSAVAIVTSAVLHTRDADAFAGGDTGYRIIDADRRDLILGHWSPNFDRAAIALDLNVVYPIDRLDELAARGVIGAVAPRRRRAGAPSRTGSSIRPRRVGRCWLRGRRCATPA